MQPSPAYVAEQPSRLCPALDAVETGIIALDEHGCVRLWNQWVERRSGRSAAQAMGKSLEDAFGTPLERRFAVVLAQTLSRGMPMLLSHALHPSPLPLFTLGCSDGERIKQQVTMKPFHPEGQARWCLLQVSDVSETVRREHQLRTQAAKLAERVQSLSDAQDELRRGEARFRQIARKAPVGMFEADAAGHLTFANERWCSFVSKPLQEIMGIPFYQHEEAEERMRIAHTWTRSVADNVDCNVECRIEQPEGGSRWIRVEVTALRGENVALLGHIGTAVDITDEKETALRHVYNATYDSLTGLHNRAHLAPLLAHAAAAASAGAGLFSVLFLDLNNFKPVNDQLGHEAGDRVLRAVARRLRRTVREDDAIVRFGGDEFVVLLTDFADRADVESLCKKIREAVAHPIDAGMQLVEITCSLGRADYGADGTDPGTLLQCADARMYEDKQLSKRTP